jgi:carboxyl-terminal processing protease
MKNRAYIYLPIWFALAVVTGIFIGAKLIPAIGGDNGIFSAASSRYDKINDVINYIENDYVDNVDKDSLTDKAISGMLQGLDPHSVYISKSEFNEVNDPLQGNFDGIGVQFRLIRDSITVINTVPGGPSEKEGVMGGDRIVKIDNKTVCGIKIKDEDVMKKLKGKRGTEVTIGVYRKGNKDLLSFKIVRGVIPTNSVDIAYMAAPGTGYIKLSKFSATTYEEVMNALMKLEGMGMQSLILDLRGNGGGYFDASIKIADEFLEQGNLIVYTEGFHRKTKEYFATKEGLFEKNKMVVLIDEWSASASEIVAGAIQDNDRGLIIGRRSFGKGLVQEQTPLADGSAIRLTVARYHTPSKRCIQKPYNKGIDEYYNDFYKSVLDDDAMDSLNFVDTVKYKTKNGRIVYGGGGIMPDIYVSMKTEDYSDYYKKIMSKGLIAQFGWEYADKNRRMLRAYGSAKSFITLFSINQTIMAEFTVFAEKAGIKNDALAQQQSDKLIRAQLKGAIGRNIFDDAAFYPVILPVDKIFQKALEALGKR